MPTTSIPFMGHPYPAWRRRTILVAFVITFLVFPIAVGLMEVIHPPPSSLEPTGEWSIYNSLHRTWRVEAGRGYVKQEGDAEPIVLYRDDPESHRWMRLLPCVNMISTGVIVWWMQRRSVQRRARIPP